MRVFAFLIEPANYTLSIIDKVYRKFGINYCFVKGESRASDKTVTSLSGVSLLKRIANIYSILRRNDVFITNSYTDKTGLIILLINILVFRKPMAIESDTELHIPKGIIRRFCKRLFLGWLFTRKCIYGFPGGYHKHVQLFKHYGMPESHIIVMPMVVDNDLYKRSGSHSLGGVFKFVYVGRLIPLKQVDKIVEAFNKLTLPNNRVELHIIGEGPELDHLKAMAKNHRVVFYGAVFGSQKVDLLHQMDCLILYSNFEQWGLVVNEALASGIPCIVSDRVGCRYDLILGDNPTGIVVSYDDIGALSSAMERIALDRELWGGLSCNAIRRMELWDYQLYRQHLSEFIAKARKGVITC